MTNNNLFESVKVSLTLSDVRFLMMMSSSSSSWSSLLSQIPRVSTYSHIVRRNCIRGRDDDDDNLFSAAAAAQPHISAQHFTDDVVKQSRHHGYAWIMMPWWIIREIVK